MRAFIAGPTLVPSVLRRVHISLLALLGACLAGTSTLRAAEPPIAVGEVRGTTASGEFSAPLRSLLNEGVASLMLAAPREHFVLSATLVSLEAAQVGRGARASAAVSLVLRRARQQTLHAVLKGQATAEATDSSVNETREDALRAAVRSALTRLPEALR
jgi:hypothetical protein